MDVWNGRVSPQGKPVSVSLALTPAGRPNHGLANSRQQPRVVLPVRDSTLTPSYRINWRWRVKNGHPVGGAVQPAKGNRNALVLCVMILGASFRRPPCGCHSGSSSDLLCPFVPCQGCFRRSCVRTMVLVCGGGGVVRSRHYLLIVCSPFFFWIIGDSATVS